MNFKNIKELEKEINKIEKSKGDLEYLDVGWNISKARFEQAEQICEIIESRLNDYKHNLKITEEGIKLNDNNLEYHKNLKSRYEESIDVLKELLSKIRGEE